MAECQCACSCCVARRLRSVYGLVDPRSAVIRYVGQARDPVGRLAEHRKVSSRRVGEWLGELDAAGVVPRVVVLAVLEGERLALEREAQWIEALNRTGPALLNVSGTRGSGKSGRTRLISMRMRDDLSEWIDGFAAEHGWTRTDVVRVALWMRMWQAENVEGWVPDAAR